MVSLGIETLCSVWGLRVSLGRHSWSSVNAVVSQGWSELLLQETIHSLISWVLHVFLVIKTNCAPVSLEMGILL